MFRCIKIDISPPAAMIDGRLNIEKIFQQRMSQQQQMTPTGRSVTGLDDLRIHMNDHRGKEDEGYDSGSSDSSNDESISNENDPRLNVYFGYFSLAGLSFFTSTVHFFLMLAVIVSSFSLKKDIKPNKITQSINVWVPELQNFNIMFPESRNLGENISLSETCRPFIPKTIPYERGFATIFPKILLFTEIDNRISIGLFFFLSFAFQFFKVVNIKQFQLHPCKQELWLGDRFYDNICKGRVSKTHFIEYSLSATLMILVMITQIGITDLSLIVNICVNTWACMIIGLLAEYILDAEEYHALRDQTLWGYHLSMITHLLGWVPLLSVVFSMIMPLTTYKTCIVGKTEIPSFVFVFVVGEIILFCSFGFVQLSSIKAVQQIRDQAEDGILYLRRETERRINAQSLLANKGRVKKPYSTAKLSKNAPSIIRDNSDGIRQAVEDDFFKQGCKTEYSTKKFLLIQNASSTEAWYVSLSLFAKTFLALTIYIGINTQPG